MLSDANDYDTRERVTFANTLWGGPSMTRAERREAGAAWLEAMRERPEVVAERAQWVLDGSYGYGAYLVARDVMPNKRMNRAAWLGQVVARLEWGCPPDVARAQWRKLTAEERGRVDGLLRGVVEGWSDGE